MLLKGSTMTQDVFELLKQLEFQNSSEKKFYIYYDPSTGEIIHFRNYFEDDSLPFIEITESEFDSPVENFDLKKYLVLKKDDKPELVKSDTISILLEKMTNIDDLIYQLPKVKSEEFDLDNENDLVIEQDNLEKVFRIVLSARMKEKFLRYRSMQQNLNVYVTAENDPNILYKTLEFKMRDLIDNDSYIIEYGDFDGEDCNLFSVKYFQSYLHVDKR